MTASSPAVSQENTSKSAKTRQVAILLENGYCDEELNQVMEAIKQDGLKMHIISKTLGTLTSANMNQVEVNKNYVTTGSIMYDAVYVPGGFMRQIKTQKARFQAKAGDGWLTNML